MDHLENLNRHLLQIERERYEMQQLLEQRKKELEALKAAKASWDEQKKDEHNDKSDKQNQAH